MPESSNFPMKLLSFLRAGALTLIDLDENTRLVVRIRREDLVGTVVMRLMSGHHPTNGLDTKGQRSDVEEQDLGGLLGSVTGEDSSLNGGTVATASSTPWFCFISICAAFS